MHTIKLCIKVVALCNFQPFGAASVQTWPRWLLFEGSLHVQGASREALAGHRAFRKEPRSTGLTQV